MTQKKTTKTTSTAGAPSTTPSAEPSRTTPVWLTAEEVAKEFRVGQRVIYSAAARGELRGIQLGGGRGLWRFKREWVDQWIDWLSEQALSNAELLTAEGSDDGRRQRSDQAAEATGGGDGEDTDHSDDTHSFA